MNQEKLKAPVDQIDVCEKPAPSIPGFRFQMKTTDGKMYDRSFVQKGKTAYDFADEVKALVGDKPRTYKTYRWLETALVQSGWTALDTYTIYV